MIKKIIAFCIKVLIILVLLGVAGYYSLNIIMSAFVDEKGEVLVPDLQGRTLVDCLETLSQAKLGLIKEGAEYNQNIPAGVVIRQTPPPGINVKEGKIIKITISQGGEIVYVPDMVGDTIRSSNIALKSVGLVLGELTKKSSIKYEEGIVLAQDPVAGSAVEKDTAINLLVSNGAPVDGTVLMPDWIGKDAVEAKQWAKDENFDVKVVEGKTNTANPGEIFKQEPSADSVITDQTKIKFFVADKKSKMELKSKTFEYNIPNIGESKRVRLVLVDGLGEKDIFNGIKAPGSKISIPVKFDGKATVKVFFNNVSIEDVQIDE